jgi:RimJ/RimL family protein N-acetyltransferase
MTTRLTAFCGNLVRLAALDLDADAALWASWNQNSEYQHLADWGPAKLSSPKEIKEWIEKEHNKLFLFSIHALADDKIIGMLDLSGINWTAGDAWLGVGIGEPEYWGKGYGREAVNLLLRFGFEQLNLRRVSLTVFEYNERAYKSYLKLGFQVEGRARQLLNRFDRRWDMIYMGILREEWEARQQEPVAQW